MSPVWRDRIRVFLAPGRVELVRSYRGIKPKQAVRLAAVCECNADLPSWQAPLEQLDQLMSEAAGADLTITISNCFMRYAVISPQIQIANPAELDAYTAFHMREVYGERVGVWALSMSAWDPCSGGICGAIESAFLQQLNELAARRKARLKSVEPYLSGVFDQWRKRFNGNRIWLAVVESGCFCLASLSNGAWQRVRNQRILRNVEDELLAALDQEAILFSGSKETMEQVYLFAPEHPGFALPSECGWQILSLPNESMPAPLHYPSAAMIAGPKNRCIA